MAVRRTVALLLLFCGMGSAAKALLPTWWRPMSGLNCDKQNNADYNAHSADVTLHKRNWGHDPNAGWRFCGISLGSCRVACVKMGKCSNVYMTPNGCCFPSMRWGPKCRGIPGGPNGKKYYVVTPHWYHYAGGTCDKQNKAYYGSRSAKARALATGWGWDPNAGYRWCNGKGAAALFQCQVACAKMGGCKSVYQTPNGCCFPNNRLATCRGIPGGPGGHKYKMLWKTPQLNQRGQDIGMYEEEPSDFDEELEMQNDDSVMNTYFVPMLACVAMVGFITVGTMVHKRYKREAAVSEQELIRMLE